MKYLSGLELVGYIKARQARQVRALRQAHRITPCLAIVQTIDSPVIDAYVRNLKQAYGDDILIASQHHKISQKDLIGTIDTLNTDPSVHGIIVQLPLDDPMQTDEAVRRVAPQKDVDGLGEGGLYDPATALAINWLCAGYNIDLAKHRILIVGQGRLVGAPLAKMWKNSGYDVSVIDRKSTNVLQQACTRATLIVSGTGVPGIITSDMIRPDTVVIDAGTASESGKIAGDVDEKVYLRDDLTITPRKGGVGPLTVAALFDNVIRAAMQS